MLTLFRFLSLVRIYPVFLCFFWGGTPMFLSCPFSLTHKVVKSKMGAPGKGQDPTTPSDSGIVHLTEYGGHGVVPAAPLGVGALGGFLQQE